VETPQEIPQLAYKHSPLWGTPVYFLLGGWLSCETPAPNWAPTVFSAKGEGGSPPRGSPGPLLRSGRPPDVSGVNPPVLCVCPQRRCGPNLARTPQKSKCVSSNRGKLAPIACLPPLWGKTPDSCVQPRSFRSPRYSRSLGVPNTFFKSALLFPPKWEHWRPLEKKARKVLETLKEGVAKRH